VMSGYLTESSVLQYIDIDLYVFEMCAPNWKIIGARSNILKKATNPIRVTNPETGTKNWYREQPLRCCVKPLGSRFAAA
jgi:hypothetical protein